MEPALGQRCDALECTGGTWQSTFVQLEACDASAK
jgi:hypothetical protein